MPDGRIDVLHELQEMCIRDRTDPDYCVLRFTADAGRFYQNFGSEDFAVPGPAGEEPGAPEA